ncbi:POK19 protein, partial [Brachypodius atriceps]|nr:POK19 protein [Brachypodius atriceps]
RHFLLAFVPLGVPQEIKTDNGPAYKSNQCKFFFQVWGIKHSTSIPHSPTGHSVVERTHHQ